MKKISTVLLTLVFALALTSSAVALDKVDVCHVTGNGDYHVISISVRALPAHLAHGDALYEDGVCQWQSATPTPTPTEPPTEPPPPVVVIAGYYMPVIYQFFDWHKYCDPRCPLGVDQSGVAINAYP